MAKGYVMLCTNSNIPRSICTKLHMFGKSPGLKTSMSMFSYRHSAISCSRKFGTYKWLWHIPPIFTILRAYCPPFAVFLKPPVGGEPGCEVPFIAACSFNIIIILLRNESHFWGPKHARKVMKLCTRIRPGENLHLILVSEMGVAKWLDSATYTHSTVCASSYVSRTCMKIGTLM